jgi:D-alanyl-D-alanine carboxypeptidase
VVVGGRTGASRDAEVQRVLSKGFNRALARERAGKLRMAQLPPPRPDADPGALGSALAGLDLSVVSAAHAALPPVRPAETASQPYGVQIGAFSDRDRARLGARRAVKAAPDFLQNRPVQIDEVARKRAPLFRARVLELSRDDARRACRELKRQRLDCLVVRIQ